MKKRHHFPSRFYLKRFAAAKQGSLWVYDLEQNTARLTSVVNAAVEKYRYSGWNADGSRNDTIENLLAEIEAKAAPHYDDLLNGKSLEGQPRADMASFLAFMFSGTDYWRRIYGEGKVRLLQSRNFNIASNPATFESALQRYERVRGALTAKEKEDLRHGFLNPQEFRIELDKTATLAAIKTHDILCPLFFRMSWSIISVNRPHFFITGDTPLTCLVPSQYQAAISGGGFVHSKAEVTFPLSPSKCLLMTRDKALPPLFQLDNPEAIDEINKLRAHYAERFLYADRDDEGVRLISQQFLAKAEGFEFSGSGPKEYAPVEVKRRSPAGTPRI